MASLSQKTIAQIHAFYYGQSFWRTYYYASDPTMQHSREKAIISWRTIERGDTPPSVNIGWVERKIILRSLENVTIGDTEDLGKLLAPNDNPVTWVNVGRAAIECYIDEPYMIDCRGYTFLAGRGYLLPLYFEGCEGKDAVELGLAEKLIV